MMTAWQESLDRVLRSWSGTPWRAGQCLRGRGVDCVRFVDAVLQELRGASLLPFPRLPQDLSLHCPRGVVRAAHAFLGRHPLERRPLCSRCLEPGDVLVYRHGGMPGHAVIIGTARGAGWHATSDAGVCFTGVGAIREGILRVWRPLDRESWRWPR